MSTQHGPRRGLLKRIVEALRAVNTVLIALSIVVATAIHLASVIHGGVRG